MMLLRFVDQPLKDREKQVAALRPICLQALCRVVHLGIMWLSCAAMGVWYFLVYEETRIVVMAHTKIQFHVRIIYVKFTIMCLRDILYYQL
jgi:hypothetical protein